MSKTSLQKTILSLPEEAKLLGTWSFIVKASVAMLAAFALGRYIPIANRDMISFLFAMMLSLEPVSATGFKRGLDQFRATLIGGLVSGLIVAVVGINPLGLALSIGVILYLTLLKDWRNLSVVALFTGIYMTQFIQLSPDGTADILMTMLVRITALTTGIIFAMVFNALVSITYIRHLPAKRICFIHFRLSKHIRRLVDKLETQLPLSDAAHLSMANLFNDIDWNHQLLKDLETDPLLKAGRLSPQEVARAIKTFEHMRTLSHYLFDLEIQLRSPELANLGPMIQEKLLSDTRTQLLSLLTFLENCNATEGPSLETLVTTGDHPRVQRIYQDLNACLETLHLQ